MKNITIEIILQTFALYNSFSSLNFHSCSEITYKNTPLKPNKNNDKNFIFLLPKADIQQIYT